jgi:hypothetical protein
MDANHTHNSNNASKAGEDISQTNASVLHVFWIQTALPDPRYVDSVTNNRIALSPSTVDSEMCHIAMDAKLDLIKQFSTVLQGNVKPSESFRTPVVSFAERTSVFSVMTQCCMHELYLQGKVRQPAVDLAKTFERRKCNHREAIPGDECLLSVVGMLRFIPMVPPHRI